MKQIVIFYSDTLSSYLLYSELISERPDFIKYLIRLPVVPKTTKNTRESMRMRILRRSGFAFLWFNFCTIVAYRFVAWLRGNQLEDIARAHDIPVFHFETIDDRLLAKLRQDRPHWILNNSPNILKQNLLDIPTLGTLNYHAAPLPTFRGAGNYFWLFVEGEVIAKASLHYVIPELDAGDIILFSKDIPIKKDMSVFDIWYGLRHDAYPSWKKLYPYFDSNQKAPANRQDEAFKKVRSFPGSQASAIIKKKGYRVMSFKNFLEIIRIAYTGVIPR